MNIEWSKMAYDAAMAAAKEPSRRRQARWDRENMVTESTRFTADLDAELRRCCREAGVTRYALIYYMLCLWMAAWKARKEESHGNSPATDHM